MFSAERAQESTRTAFTAGLPQLASQNDVLIIDTDTGSIRPEPGMNYVNVGIAESAAIGLAAGAAHLGQRALVCTFAAFAVSRAFEFIKLDIAYPSRQVCLVGTHSGSSGGWLGPTHHCTEDLALMNTLPNLRVVVPADAAQTISLLEQCLIYDGPTYLRLGRKTSPVFPELAEPVLGSPQEVRAGHDIAIIATGPEMLAAALSASAHLDKIGYSAQVINLHSVDRLSVQGITSTLSPRCRWLITLEDAWTSGGMGAQVAAAVGSRGIPWLPIGVTGFLEPGAHPSLLEASGLTPESITEQITSFINKCNRN